MIRFHEGGFDPEAPNHNISELTVDNYDGTVTRTTYDRDGKVLSTETASDLPLPEPPVLSETQVLAKMVLAPRVRDDAVQISDTELAEMAQLFPEWEHGIRVAAGDVLRWDGTLVEAIQSHVTQADWMPGETPALWKVHRESGNATEWVQPAGAHDAYWVGDRVSHRDQIWVSISGDNVWEPGVFGWDVLADLDKEVP